MKSKSSILIYRHGSLGDTIVALPVLHAIARTFPTARRVILTKRRTNQKAAQMSEVLDGTGLVHGYIEYSDDTSSWELYHRIRAERAVTLIYLLSPPLRRKKFYTLRSIRTWLFWRICGIRTVIGQPMLSSQLQVRQLSSGYYESRASFLARRVSSIADVQINEPDAFDLMLSSGERADAQTVLAPLFGRKFIAISVGTKTEVNDWEDVRWGPMLSELAARYPDYGLVAIGSADEAERCEKLCRPWAGRYINCCGRLSVRVSGAVLQQADVFVGHDSGPMHLAAAVGTCCVAIFSSRNYPGEWFPVGERHHVLYREISCQACYFDTCLDLQKACIRSITVAEVLSAIDRVIQYRQ